MRDKEIRKKEEKNIFNFFCLIGEGGGLEEEIKENEDEEDNRNGKSSFDIENQPNQQEEEEEDENFNNNHRWSSFRKDSLGFYYRLI